MDRQKYYETKLHKLMNSPQIKKVFEMAAKGSGAEPSAPVKNLPEQDPAASQPDLKKVPSYTDILDQKEKQNKRNLMRSALHQKERELEQVETKKKQEDQIKSAMAKRDETKRMINQELDQNR